MNTHISKQPAGARNEGGLLVGCAIACATLIIVTLVAVLLIVRWLFAPTEIPDAQSAMLADTQSFVVARLDSQNKAVIELIDRVVTESLSEEVKQETPPAPIRWMLGKDTATILKKFLPIQIVLSDNPRIQQMAIVFSPGRGRGLASLLSRSLAAVPEKPQPRHEFVKYRGLVIIQGKRQERTEASAASPPWWFTLNGTNLCAANTVESAKGLIDVLARPSEPSKIAALYPTLKENAVMCGATADIFRARQIAAWLCPEEPRLAASLAPGSIKQGTFKLTLNEQMTLHAQIELTCANPQMAQQMQKGMQSTLAPKQEAKKISGLRVAIQDDKLFLDLDVPDVDRVLIDFIEAKKKEADKPPEKPTPPPAPKEQAAPSHKASAPPPMSKEQPKPAHKEAK